MMKEEFPKRINLVKLELEGNKDIYKYKDIPESESEKDFVRKRDGYYSLKNIGTNEKAHFNPYYIQKIIENAFKDKLNANSYISNDKYVFYKEEDKIRHNQKNEEIFSIFKGFGYRIIPIKNDLLFNLDYRLIIRCNASIQELLDLNVPESLLINKSVKFRDFNGKLIEIQNNGHCKVNFYNDDLKTIPSNELNLLCRPELLRHILIKIGRPEDIISLQRKYSLIRPKPRLLKIEKLIEDLKENIFPLTIEGLTVKLDNGILPIEEIGYSTFYDDLTLKYDRILDEPELQFHRSSSYKQPFPTSYPPFLKVDKLSLAFYYPQDKNSQIYNLSKGLERYLKDYYRVDEITIDFRPINHDPFNENYTENIKSSIKFSDEISLAIIYVPETMKYYQNSSYYTLKTYFASQGIPTQMVTEKALKTSLQKGKLNYTLLNMCTAITAKCGGIPWVLKTKLKEIDVVIGMSISTKLSNIGEDAQKNRYVGFANIFNEYGKWLYFFGTAHKYDKNQQKEQIIAIIKEMKNHYSQKNYPLPKNIAIHNTKRSRWKDRKEIYKIIRDNFGEDSKCVFIGIDESHNYRCFDFNSKDLSLPRGDFIYLNQNEILLSTTGESNLKGAFRHGTPKLLKISTDQYPEKFLNLEDIAYQVLALTKLNWASVNPAQREPVSVKYANKLAYIAANIGTEQWNTINHRFFKQPWFI